MVDPPRNRNPPRAVQAGEEGPETAGDGQKGRAGKGEPKERARMLGARTGGRGGKEAAGRRGPDMTGGGLTAGARTARAG